MLSMMRMLAYLDPTKLSAIILVMRRSDNTALVFPEPSSPMNRTPVWPMLMRDSGASHNLALREEGRAENGGTIASVPDNTQALCLS
jgi:hypothetical protein